MPDRYLADSLDRLLVDWRAVLDKPQPALLTKWVQPVIGLNEFRSAQLSDQALTNGGTATITGTGFIMLQGVVPPGEVWEVKTIYWSRSTGTWTANALEWYDLTGDTYPGVGNMHYATVKLYSPSATNDAFNFATPLWLDEGDYFVLAIDSWAVAGVANVEISGHRYFKRAVGV